jgi:tRNA-dihydrouridine synthase B
VFARAEAALAGRAVPPPPGPREKVALAIRHLRLCVAEKGVHIGVREMRRHVSAYIKGMPHATDIRSAMMALEDPDEVERMLWEIAERTIQNSECRTMKLNSMIKCNTWP